jgi:2-polyprenyl-3-methyl-5-hydroxy-6-metoxy-1,4-benzoquinol methylase
MAQPVSETAAKVLAFYGSLPFNRHATAAAQAAGIRRHDATEAYPVLRPLLQPGTQVLDAGCGTGWLSNSMRLRYPARVTGVDFNPSAITFAQEVARALGVDTAFAVADLFSYSPGTRYDVIVSIGALHHTGDCHGAIRRIVSDLLAPGGHFFIGLYHHHGRAPFLAHFDALRARGADEATLFDAYRQLHPRTQDETHLRSWFRDQVLHPHETQHTLTELLPVLRDAGLELTATSLNSFATIDDLPALLASEAGQRDLAIQRLQEGRYFPGFFLLLARKYEAT